MLPPEDEHSQFRLILLISAFTTFVRDITSLKLSLSRSQSYEHLPGVDVNLEHDRGTAIAVAAAAEAVSSLMTDSIQTHFCSCCQPGYILSY